MNMLACSFVGSARTVREGLEGFIRQTGADEIIAAAAIYDHSKRLRSYEILSEVHKAMGKKL
jgi:alkanesulfonate monooxygenase SsuD/methylene tetrahydromethanopterin reductase-like flavin-dependent oxidoreductase (luciferase family)